MATKINAKSTGGGFEMVPDASGALDIQSNSVTAISIDSSQNVGIGTNTPTSKLTVVGNASITGTTTITGTASITGNTTLSGNIGLGIAPTPYRLTVNGSSQYKDDFYTVSRFTVNTGTSQTLQVGSDGEGGYHFLWGLGNYALDFATNNIARMRITTNGGISFGSSGTAYGTSGQVLTSNGNAPPTWANASSIGVGQTWQDVTASRAAGTTYTNSTGKPIFVMISVYNSQAANILLVTVSGVLISAVGQSTWDNSTQASFIVPDGATYSATSSSGVRIWAELR